MVQEAEGGRLVSIGAGAVALTHRPKVRALPTLRAAGVTHLVTLLSRQEGAPALGAAAQAAGLHWTWIEVPNGIRRARAARAARAIGRLVHAGHLSGPRVVPLLAGQGPTACSFS